MALVVERPLDLACPSARPERARGDGAGGGRFNGDPTATLKVVGVTGTNGKTTTAFLVRELLEAGGLQSGCSGR